ncbi:IQ domain-containing protein C [Elgaria multicarinata webbii]|uniref:IQ domain-containing protein C n=1 Tax=Elgaria multicarinata webbii TaxID=159646 RepID=UPI002FCD5CEF
MEAVAREQRLMLLRSRVMVLQAFVRGHLVRKRFQSLKGEYESIVKEVEGNLDCLQWNRHSLPRPVFIPKSVQKLLKFKELKDQEAGSNKTMTQERFCQEELLSEEECREMLLPSRLPAELVAEGEAGDMRQKVEHLMDHPSGNPCSLPVQREDPSNVSSEWSSTILDTESARLSQELPFRKVQEMPQTVSDLQHYRKHLAMELLWLQQAIVSRKNYLILKQRFGSSEGLPA